MLVKRMNGQKIVEKDDTGLEHLKFMKRCVAYVCICIPFPQCSKEVLCWNSLLSVCRRPAKRPVSNTLAEGRAQIQRPGP